MDWYRKEKIPGYIGDNDLENDMFLENPEDNEIKIKHKNQKIRGDKLKKRKIKKVPKIDLSESIIIQKERQKKIKRKLLKKEKKQRRDKIIEV